MKRLEVLQIPRQRHDAQAGKDELDPVTAFLEDFEPGRGQLTLVCWGRSWTHFWGAMGNGATLREFLTSASSGYIVGKLMLTRDVLLKRAEPREERWLSQIVEALKAQIAATAAQPPQAAPKAEAPAAPAERGVPLTDEQAHAIAAHYDMPSSVVRDIYNRANGITGGTEGGASA